MDVKQKLRLGRVAENLWLFSKGLYGRDYPPKMLMLAAIVAEIIPEYIKDPDGMAELFEDMSAGFLREWEKYKTPG